MSDKTINVQGWKKMKLQEGDVIVVRVPLKYDLGSVADDFAYLGSQVGCTFVAVPEDMKLSILRKEIEDER